MSRAQATIVEDSIAPSGIRLTTMLLTYATMVHQDILTHRTMYKLNVEDEPQWIELDANKSTNSNRAKPTKQVLHEVWVRPFVPTRFPKRAVTMHSSKGYLEGWRALIARHVWLKARYVALTIALLLMWIGVHKQVANRLLMPWTYTTLVITAVAPWWRHFFSLRDHFAAQDEVRDVASLAHVQYTSSVYTALAAGDWHLPFITQEEHFADEIDLPESTRIMLSVARCARTSYASTHVQMMQIASSRPIADDLELFKRLARQTPEHAGPAEHTARAMADANHYSGTLFGWSQLRHDTMWQKLKDNAKDV